MFKNNPQLINFFMHQVATILFFLSKTGRSHGHLTLASLYFPVFKGFLKPDGMIKIGGLGKCFNVRSKE